MTGPAGYSADAIKVFERINGSLIGAAFLLVLRPADPHLPQPDPSGSSAPHRGLRGDHHARDRLGAHRGGVTVNGQSSSILSVLVLGAGTDYALLIVARYREELRQHEDRTRRWPRRSARAGPAIFASGADRVRRAAVALRWPRSTAPRASVRSARWASRWRCSRMLTFLPALLVIAAARPFWPFVPMSARTGSDATHGSGGGWASASALRPRRVWVVRTAVLVLMALGCLNFNDRLTRATVPRLGRVGRGPEADRQGVPGRRHRAHRRGRARPGGRGAVRGGARGASEGVATASVPVAAGRTASLLDAILDVDPYSTRGLSTSCPALRRAAHEAAARARSSAARPRWSTTCARPSSTTRS